MPARPPARAPCSPATSAWPSVRPFPFLLSGRPAMALSYRMRHIVAVQFPVSHSPGYILRLKEVPHAAPKTYRESCAADEVTYEKFRAALMDRGVQLLPGSRGRHPHSTLSLAVVGWSPFLRDLHAHLAVIAVIFSQYDSAAPGCCQGGGTWGWSTARRSSPSRSK